MYSNYICHVAWFSSQKYSEEKIISLIMKYNNVSVDEDNYMSQNFANTYFSLEDCRKIGFIREDIEKRFKPDLIHVFGTEFPHSLEALKLDPDRTLVDIQGLIGVYAEHYFLRIPASLTVPGVNRLTGKHISPIYENMLAFKKRGVYEKSALKRARYVTGRTEWDLACMRYINPKAEYYACNRILRESFYGHEWKYNNVIKHSILISHADYPVKWFHIFLKALHLLRRDQNCPWQH